MHCRIHRKQYMQNFRKIFSRERKMRERKKFNINFCHELEMIQPTSQTETRLLSDLITVGKPTRWPALVIETSLYSNTAGVPNHWNYFMRHQGLESVIFSVLDFNFDCFVLSHIANRTLLQFHPFTPFSPFKWRSGPASGGKSRASTRYRLVSP